MAATLGPYRGPSRREGCYHAGENITYDTTAHSAAFVQEALWVNMFSVVVAGVAVLFLLSGPITEWFSPGPGHIPRTPRPRINESLLAIDSVNDTLSTCPPDAYSIHVISKAPLVIYIENFLFPEERQHLLDAR